MHQIDITFLMYFVLVSYYILIRIYQFCLVFENIKGQADFINGLKEFSFHPYKINKENWLLP